MTKKWYGPAMSTASSTTASSQPSPSGTTIDAAPTAIRIEVRGQVPGVGFRPFVYRLAQQCRLGSRVCNAPSGVVIELEGTPESLACFQERLRGTAPPGAEIDGLTVHAIPPRGLAVF